ncbi:acyltransferase family protein [Arcticibacterium luteifluviistationis]|uniref:Acyltransferase 3 domain-containing protein n=1 Tax=Arcticibacterium luteifluviistationis TaxID=1784714 RepID=A0A2Z4GAF2_9BACT|nr:hypothetical protein DJ013_07630 [Arcticibacterium luteifluviistationis]
MKYLNFFNGLRGLLCIWVVLFHYTTRYAELYGGTFTFSYNNGGKVGVCIFFLISGYLTLLTVDKYHRNGGLLWLKNKILRLYPAYLISCLFIFPFLFYFKLEGRYDIAFIDLLKDILILPYVSGKIEGAHWYVFALVKFYFTFSIIAKFKLQDSLWFYITILFLTVTQAFLKRQELLPLFNLNFLLFSFFNIQIIAGLLLYKALKTPRKYLLLFMVYVLLLAFKIHLFYIPLIIALLYFLISNQSNLTRIKGFLEYPILQKLGSVSYIWYLIHQNIGYILIKKQISVSISKEIVPYTTMIATLIVAQVSYLSRSPYIKAINFK